MSYRNLVVDDDKEVLDVLYGLMTMKGYEVVTAQDGMTAITAVSKYRPDLMILDVSMPRMSGFQTCQAIRRTKGYESIPVIFLTAKKAEADKKYGQRVGGDVFITKPYNQNELLYVVDKLLRERARPDVEREPLDPLKRDADWQD